MTLSESQHTDDDRDISSPLTLWQAYWDYATDCWQRNVLFLDVLRQRGNQYLEHAAKPVQHVLNYEFEKVMDGREFTHPVNYGLFRLLPPDDVEIDADKRPFVIVDPRVGHGAGIGGFKPDSEVGAALHAGHPCYVVGFLSEPAPGQTIEDVGCAKLAFFRKVGELHPSAEGKPCIIANCRAGWAIMMVAATAPDALGPLLVVGSPISCWAGVHSQNPMRYTGGPLGGTWSTSLCDDLGNGIFDGAHLVRNFESLNPANTLWAKQYNLWSKIDTEAPRYLDFERYWGGHVLLTGEEMQFIADELFVGSRLTRGEMQTSEGIAIDIRNIRSPIVIFCSNGDNITPPQQALRWILDLYDSVDEIRAYGQTFIYSVHPDIGHLGIFLSGRVGRKEHDQFTHNMDFIDLLPAGLYEAVIRYKGPEDCDAEHGHGDFIVAFENRTLEDIRAFGDAGEDEKALAAVARVSEINKSLYRTFVSPIVRTMVTEQSSEWTREFNPARLQYSIFSDQNPLMAWTAAAAASVESTRRPVGDDNPFKDLERQCSKGLVAWLEAYREIRDLASEQFFFGIYGSELTQKLVGLKSSGNEDLRQNQAYHPSHAALVREKIGKLKERIGVGGQREAAARALIYVALTEGRVDERAFGALKEMHRRGPKYMRMSLSQFKQLIREQSLMLLLDERKALQALPHLLPVDAGARKKLFKRVLKVTAAAGPPSERRLYRLRRLAEVFGLAADKVVCRKLSNLRRQSEPIKAVRRARRKSTRRVRLPPV